MSKHSTFTLERVYDAPAERVFACWASPEIKPRWFGCAKNIRNEGYSLDFRVGGRETNRAFMEGQTFSHDYEATYHVIVPNERIVYSYTMDKNARRMSVSLTTVEFTPVGSGTRMTFTEQGVFLDDEGWIDTRESGSAGLLDAIQRELDRQASRA